MNNRIIKVYIVGGDKSYVNLFLDEIKIVTKVSEANIVLFTGGEDVCPAYYGENTGKYTQCNRLRDESEIKIFNEAKNYKKFCLGICRGNQLLTVLSGGGLIQHVTGHGISGKHKIHLMNEDIDIDITSTHHQMIYPYYLDKKDYTILAKSKDNLSKTYLNGDNKEKSLSDNFVECEIVYYNRTNCLCIQGHPEYMPKNSSAVKYINVLIREYLEDTVEIVPEVVKPRFHGINIHRGNGILEQLEQNQEILINPLDIAVNNLNFNWQQMEVAMQNIAYVPNARDINRFINPDQNENLDDLFNWIKY